MTIYTALHLKSTYIFHGSPDVTICKSKCVHKAVAPQEEVYVNVVAKVVVQDVGAAEEDSDHESVYSESAVVEVHKEKPPLSDFDPKLGELFANMHIMPHAQSLKTVCKGRRCSKVYSSKRHAYW